MGQAEWPGLQERLRERIAELGFKNPSRFADEKRYRVTQLHKWLSTTTPSRATLDRLAQDLGVTAWWLLFGDQSGVSKAPANPRKRGGRKIGCLVAALLSTMAWGPTPASASASAIRSEPTAATTYYVKRRRRGYSLWGRGNPDPLRSGYPRLTACAA